MPLLEVELPGVTVRTFEPSALISEVTWLDAPSPRPTAMITPAMPMRMPEHGQEGAQPVAAHAVDAGPECLEPAHRMLWLSR